MRSAKARKGITIVEAAFISAITTLLGFVLIFLASGWAQVSLHDITRKTDEYVQSFRALLAVELINYTEAGAEIRVRNVSKWDISLTIVGIDVLKDGEVIDSFYENISLAKNDDAKFPIPVDCKRGESLAFRIKYAPTAFLERALPPLVIEANFTCPISIIPNRCSLPEKWTLIDVIDLITTPSGEISQTYPYIWVKAPLSSTIGEERLNIHVYGREGSSSKSFLIGVPSTERIPLKISGEDVKPPYDIVLEAAGLYYIPNSFRLGGFVDENGVVEIHVSGITLLWSPEDKVAEGVIVELGATGPGSYIIKVNIEDCKGDVLLTREIPYSYKDIKSGWDFIYVGFAREFKATDIYRIETSIVKVSS